MLKENQVVGILMETSHYTKADTEFTPKGTLMLHYALTEFGTPELAEEYENSKGDKFSSVKTGEHKGKPIHFTSQIFNGVEVGDKVLFEFANNRLQRSESLEERIAKSAEKKAKQALGKVLSPETVAKMELAKKLGLSVSI